MTYLDQDGALHAEQLVYTWARTGLEGPNQYQVRAASSGLHDPVSTGRAAARQLCRYSRDPEVQQLVDLPVSFGSLRDGASRLVFRRNALGVDGWGRSGGFFAHVVVADPAVLSTAAAAHLWDAGFWHSDEASLTDSTELELLRLDEWVSHDARSSLGASQRISFLAELLSAFAAGRRVAVVGDWRSIAAHVAAALEVLPRRAVERLSFSSFEHGEPVAWFDVVGLSRGDPSISDRHLIDLDEIEKGVARQRDEAVDRLAEGLLAGGDQVTAAAADAALSERGTFSFNTFVDAHAVLKALATGSPPSDRDVHRLLGVPSSARLLNAFDVGARCSADALIHGDSHTWEALGVGLSGLRGSERRALVEALASVAVESTGGTIEQTWSRLAELDQVLAELLLSEVHRHVCEEPSLALMMADQDAVRLLVHATETVDDVDDSVAALVDRRWSDPLGAASVTAVHAPWAAVLLVRAIREPALRVDAIRTLLGRCRPLTGHVVGQLARTEELIDLADDVVRLTSPAIAGRFALDVCSADVPGAQRVQVVRLAAGRVRGSERLALLCAARPRIVRALSGSGAATHVAQLASDAVAESVLAGRRSATPAGRAASGDAANRAHLPQGTADLMRALASYGEDARAWAEILSGRSDDPFSVWEAHWETPKLISGMTSEVQRRAAAETAFVRAVWCQSEVQLASSVHELLADWLDADPLDLAEVLLLTALPGGASGQGVPPIVVVTVASLIGRGGLRLSLRGVLPDHLQEPSEDAVSQLSHQQRLKLEQWAASRSSAQRKWIHGLLVRTRDGASLRGT